MWLAAPASQGGLGQNVRRKGKQEPLQGQQGLRRVCRALALYSSPTSPPHGISLSELEYQACQSDPLPHTQP